MLIKNEITNEDIEELFSTSKLKKNRRKNDYKKAKRKEKISKSHGFNWYNNLHQYSKNKIHCSCCLCRGKDFNGKHIESKQEYKNRLSWKDFEKDYVDK